MKIYKYKEKFYSIAHQAKMKINGEWENCVIYKALYDHPLGDIFVRSSEEFFFLFKEEEEPKFCKIKEGFCRHELKERFCSQYSKCSNQVFNNTTCFCYIK